MKKIFIFVLLVLVGISMLNLPANLKADEARTIAKKSKAIIANEVTSTQGITLYKVTGYANAANSVFGLYNASTLGTATAAVCKVEGGEATQYDSLLTLDFCDEGIEFPDGLTTVVNGAYVTIVYN